MTVARAAGDRFVLAHRAARPARDPWQHQGVLVEAERAADGRIERTATVFLTGRECPWRCVMCDLWQYTTADDTPRGAIPAQMAAALDALARESEPPTVIKLYNAGSFFDRRAVPPADLDAIVAQLAGFARVIVESHPALVGEATWRLRDALHAATPGLRLEVAVGLETAHPEALARLNKGVTVDDVAAAAEALRQHDVDLRVFLLIGVPFVPLDEQDVWLARSMGVAAACGATVTSLIPTRPGEGALNAIAAQGWFTPPTLVDVERAAGLAAAQAGRRVFIDTWDLVRLARCVGCAEARLERLRRFNLEQRLPAAVSCAACGAGMAA